MNGFVGNCLSDPQFFSENGEKRELHHQEQEQMNLLPALVDEGGPDAQSALWPGGSPYRWMGLHHAAGQRIGLGEWLE